MAANKPTNIRGYAKRNGLRIRVLPENNRGSYRYAITGPGKVDMRANNVREARFLIRETSLSRQLDAIRRDIRNREVTEQDRRTYARLNKQYDRLWARRNALR